MMEEAGRVLMDLIGLSTQLVTLEAPGNETAAIDTPFSSVTAEAAKRSDG